MNDLGIIMISFCFGVSAGAIFFITLDKGFDYIAKKHHLFDVSESRTVDDD
jgi:hypothetical protein